MQKYSVEWANKMLELNPDWMAIAVDGNGIGIFSDSGLIAGATWYPTGDTIFYGTLGNFTYDGDWKDTLVVRKCSHYTDAQYNPVWKYCPLCGELLGSK